MGSPKKKEKITDVEAREQEAVVIETDRQKEIGEFSDMINFLEKTAGILPAVMAIVKTDKALLKSFYQTEHEKWSSVQSCNMAKVMDSHEVNTLGVDGMDFISSNMAEISEYMVGNVGNKQSQTLTAKTELRDGRVLEAVVTGIRIVPLTPEEIQTPTDLITGLKATMLDVNLRETVDLITLRRRSVSLIKGDTMPKDKVFKYGMRLAIRDKTKAEEKVTEEKETK